MSRVDSVNDDERSFVKGSSPGAGKDIAFSKRNRSNAPRFGKRVPENPCMFFGSWPQNGNNPERLRSLSRKPLGNHVKT